MTALDTLVRRAWPRLAPPPRLALSEWADSYRRLPAESSAEPGRWSSSRVPYLKAPLDAVTDRSIETVVVVSASQAGKTEVLLNTIAYHVHLDPAPVLLLEPTLEMAAAVAKDRIAPMIRDTPVLRDRIATPRAKDGQNTTLHKTFAGGSISLAGANSPASLASRPIRVLLADEVDRWPAQLAGEGDPLALALARTTTFTRRKIVITSSPTVDGGSRIQDWWNLSDMRRFHVACSECRALFVLDWSTIRWNDDDPETAGIECPTCTTLIPGRDRDALVAAGTWIATHTDRPTIAGFHVPGVLAPWRSLPEHVRVFLAARRSLEARQAWTNTIKGDWWTPPTEGGSLDPGHLLVRREDFAGDGVLPEGVKILTAGCDVHADRLEYAVFGWGAGEECWTIDRDSIPGDPGHAETWAALDAVLDYDFPIVRGGTMRVQCVLVDAGFATQATYNAVIPRQGRRVYASFGRSGGEKGLLVSPPKAIRPQNGTGNVLRRIVDVDQAKALIMNRLKITEPGPEYIHLGRHVVDETFVNELTAEVLVTKRNKYGVPTKVWEQRRDRNETLDVFCYALAALRIVAPTPAKFQALAAAVARLGRTA